MYLNWADNGNENRYQNTLSHGKSYDTKNMMHTIRLFWKTDGMHVRRPNRDYLLEIRAGKFEFDELLAYAESLLQHIEVLHGQSLLPEQPDKSETDRLLVSVREAWYTRPV